jgi:hypothetical protein
VTASSTYRILRFAILAAMIYKMLRTAPTARTWSSEQLPLRSLTKCACDEGDSKIYAILTSFATRLKFILLANGTSYELSGEDPWIDYPTRKPGSLFLAKRAAARHNHTMRRVQYRLNIGSCVNDRILTHGGSWKSYGGHCVWLEGNKLCFAVMTIPIAATMP